MHKVRSERFCGKRPAKFRIGVAYRQGRGCSVAV